MKVTPALEVTVRETIAAASSGERRVRRASPSATSGAAAEVQAGSTLSAAALRVRFVALAGKLQVPESQLAEIE